MSSAKRAAKTQSHSWTRELWHVYCLMKSSREAGSLFKSHFTGREIRFLATHFRKYLLLQAALEKQLNMSVLFNSHKGFMFCFLGDSSSREARVSLESRRKDNLGFWLIPILLTSSSWSLARPTRLRRGAAVFKFVCISNSRWMVWCLLSAWLPKQLK